MPLYTPTLLKDAAWVPPSTAVAADDEFGDDSFDSAWVEVAPTGSATWTESRSILSAKSASVLSGDMLCRLKAISVSSGGYIETCLRLMSFGNFSMAGLVFSNGVLTSSTAVGAFVWQGGGGLNARILTGTITSMSSATNVFQNVSPQIYTRLVWVSANTWRQQLSVDGVSWTTFGVTDTSSTMTPTHMGVFITNWGGAADALASFEYFRASA